MENFIYQIDQKVTVWERATVSIEAKTKEEAEAIAKQIFNNELDLFDFDPEYDTLIETSKDLDPADNDGQSTRELVDYEDNSRIVATNEIQAKQEANPKPTAAAPEMLEALKLAQRKLLEFYNFGESAELNAVRDAIQKATE